MRQKACRSNGRDGHFLGDRRHVQKDRELQEHRTIISQVAVSKRRTDGDVEEISKKCAEKNLTVRSKKNIKKITLFMHYAGHEERLV